MKPLKIILWLILIGTVVTLWPNKEVDGQTACSSINTVTCATGGNIYAHTHTDLGIPSGLITMVLSGTCPTGFTEATALNGKMLQGTLAANGNVGTTGGSSTITPTGSISTPTFTGTPFSSVINHTHTITSTLNLQGGTTAATTGTHVMTSTATGGSIRAATTGDGVASTSANPSGGVASITPAGTISTPTFTGSPIDPSPSFVRVIFCSKT